MFSHGITLDALEVTAPLPLNSLGSMKLLLFVVIGRVSRMFAGHVSSQLAAVVELEATEHADMLLAFFVSQTLGNHLFKL